MAHAPSSASSSCKYDVFLSFRGKDTRYKFTSHLYEALRLKGVRTFMDDELRRGEEITPALLRTIEESRISVVILSENYASSPWCVDELVKILECKQAYGQIVLPVFYHVDPSDVSEQTGSFGKAFADLEKNFGGTMNKVPTWRADLTKAANISGWDSQIVRSEPKLVNDIVQHILKELNGTPEIYSRGFVGMDSHVEQIVKLLCMDASTVRIIGIWGMGGIGKTTIAKSVFASISHQYGGHCFLENVGHKEKECGGLACLQEKFLSKILCEETLCIEAVGLIPYFVRERLRRLKVLAVLDDVSDVRQLEDLIQGSDCFGPGSRIIVITRDRQAIRNQVDAEYEVKGLNDTDALQLFSLSAFRKDKPQTDFVELSTGAINYAKGNPLALKVLGSFLYKREKQIWESALNELDRIPQLKILDVLRVGYDILQDKVKSVFLDVACFFEGQQVDSVKAILDRPGFSTEILFPILVDKCLLTISNDKLEMHDLVKEMAHEIVQQESHDELGKRSRFWSPAEVYDLLTKNLGTAKVTGIFADISKVKEMKLSPESFESMYNLRFLKLYNSRVGGNNHRVYLPHGLSSLPDALRYLHWDQFPSKSLPSTFSPENLAVLNLSGSNVEQLWKGDQSLVNLTEMNLGSCKNLIAVPDLKRAAKLESLNLQFCTALESVPLSIRYLDKLIDLDLRQCTSLKSLPSSFLSRSLKTLNLAGCSNIEEYPETAGNLTYLNLNETAIEEVPHSIGGLTSLRTLNLKNCKRLENLPDNICLLKSLEILDLSGCSNIRMLPDLPERIRYLYLYGNAVKELPCSVGCLSRLSSLQVINCKRIKDLPHNILKFVYLERLNLSGCSSISKFPPIPWCVKELYLDGTGVEEIPSSIMLCSRLVELHLKDCVRFEVLPSSICKLKSLQRLNLSGCSGFRKFPELLEKMDCLRYLYLDGTAIRDLPRPIENLCNLACFELGNCKYLDGKTCFPDRDFNLELLRKLCLDNCCLTGMPDFLVYLSSLEALDLSNNEFDTLPSSIGTLTELQYLGLRNCGRLRSLPELPPRLTTLDARGCISLRGYSSSSALAEGNVFDFLFTGCYSLSKAACVNIMSYAMKKIQLYSKRLYSQSSHELVGTCSFIFPTSEIPRWFNYRASGSSLTIQLPSLGAGNEFFGFILCAIVSYDRFFEDAGGFQVKCRYVFMNNNGDIREFHSYLNGCYYPWKDIPTVEISHRLLGYDPCLGASEDIWCGRYTEVLIEFFPEDMNNNPLCSCEVIQCGVCLHTQHEKYPYDLVIPGPVDQFQKTCKIPEWFEHRAIGSSLIIESSVLGVSNEFFGFMLCAIVSYDWFLEDAEGFQIKCRFVFKDNDDGDIGEFHSYLNRCYYPLKGISAVKISHLFLGQVPCLGASEDICCGRYTAGLIEFCPEDMNGNFLRSCKVRECGVCQHTQHEKYLDDLIIPGPVDQVRLTWEIPKWFEHQALGSSLTIQLPVLEAGDVFLGCMLCAIVSYDRFFENAGGFQVKCKYIFKNNDGDIREFHRYPWKCISTIEDSHLLFGNDYRLGASEDIWCGRYTEVLIEFCSEDMNNNPLCSCQVSQCAVHLEIYKALQLSSAASACMVKRQHDDDDDVKNDRNKLRQLAGTGEMLYGWKLCQSF